jgi:serine/threonine protein kinase/outer membrane protein assembly factor BamB
MSGIEQLGSYRLIRLLGEGGFAHVYLGQHLYLKNYAAVKVLHAPLGATHVQSFLAEAQTLAHLMHPHIVRIFDFAVEGDTPYLVMEYHPNGTLRQWHPKGTRVQLAKVISYVNQIAAGLQYAHDQRVVHRDIKSENMLLGSHNEIILTDFGLATIVHTTVSRSPQIEAGTLLYMAPDQIRGMARPASDQYSLGILVYEWLCGSPPFSGNSLFELYHQHLSVLPTPLCQKDPSIPGAVEAVLMRALEKDWQRRFSSIQEFAAAFEQAAQIGSVSPVSSTPSSAGSSHVPSAMPPSPPAAALASYDTVPSLSTARAAGVAAPAAGVSSSDSAPVLSPVPAPRIPLKPPPPSQKKPPTFGGRLPKRRTLLLLGLVCLFLVGSIGLLSPTLIGLLTSQRPITTSPVSSQLPTVSDFPMFGFDPQHTRFNRSEHIIYPDNVAHLKEGWIATTGGTKIESSPAIANGIVYIGSYDQKLYAYSTTCGNTSCPPLWVSKATGDNIESSPAIADGVVYVGSLDGKLYAFKATAQCSSPCPPLWVSKPTGRQIDSSPTVANGIVYIGSEDHRLYAFKATAQCSSPCPALWVSDATAGGIHSSPAVNPAQGAIYVGSLDGKLYAFNASTGATLWVSDATGGQIDSSPAVADGIVYVGSKDARLYAFKASSCVRNLPCSPYWVSNPTGGDFISSSPAVANGVVYIGSSDGKLYAFDASGCGGQPFCTWLWVSDATGAQIVFSSPVVANGVVYIGSWDNKLYAFKATAQCSSPCPALWVSDATGGQIDSSPAVADGVVYVGSADGTLYTFHLP